MGRYVFIEELALHGLDGRVAVALPRVLQSPTPTVDELLASCPGVSEIRSITTDFDIRWDPYLSRTKYTCVPGGAGSNVALALWNTFRCMKLITFDSPVPLFNDRNLYHWLKNAHPAPVMRSPSGDLPSWNISPIYIVHSTTGSESRGAENPVARVGRDGIRLMDWFLDDPRLPGWSRAWLSPYGMRNAGVMGLVEILLHEAWHAVSGVGMPDCLPGGAHQATYWYYRWLAEHSRSYLSDEQKAVAARNAGLFLSEVEGC